MEHKGKLSGIIAVPLFAAFAAAYMISHDTIVIHVEGKSAGWDRPLMEPGRAARYHYMVHTADETFIVARAWLDGDFQPDERWHQLQKGKSYRVRVAGWRIGYFHWYRNILAIESEA